MEKLIPIVNRVQDALGRFEREEGISFPRLVVVGSQSSGKSSVLESLVGKDFLPRGSGIVTRRPLILQLEYSPRGSEIGVFSHKSNIQMRDFSEIRREIEAETERLVGRRCGISSEPIRLKITSPNVVDITLIDLPGMTKVPVGDQPHDISEQIRKMILDYIKDKNSIILAISAANQDLANSDSLRIAHEVDPQGERTIGVITKIDIMDRGTDALSMLTGKLYPLALGYIGIICRSQEDINRQKPMQQHLDDEMIFFTTHEKYKHIANKMGTKYLSITLNKLLKKHIIKSLPGFKKKINERLRNADNELKNYGIPIQGNRDFQGVVILNIITAFSGAVSKTMEGRLASEQQCELNGGAQIRHMLFSIYTKEIMSIDPFDAVSDQDIRTAILNSQGIKSNYLIPQDALEILIRVQIKKLLSPSLKALETILDYMKSFIREVTLPEYQVYPNLQNSILYIAQGVLESCNKPTNEFIYEIIENELAFINLDHPKLLSVEEAYKRAETEYKDLLKARLENTAVKGGWFSRSNPVNKAPEIASERETKDMFFTRNIVISYFNIIRKNVGDFVIKAIMTLLVKKSIEKLQNELLTHLYLKDNFDEILYESPEIPQKRQALAELVTSLRKAAIILDEIRDMD